MKSFVYRVLALGIPLILYAAAQALPPLPKYIEAQYSSSSEHAKYLEMYKGLEMDHQCAACHKPGIEKKVKGHALNDYGQAVAKHFKHRDFNKADKLGKDNADEAAKARQLIAEALAKADAEKNAAGQAFGELSRAGKLPGTN